MFVDAAFDVEHATFVTTVAVVSGHFGVDVLLMGVSKQPVSVGSVCKQKKNKN